MQSLASYRENLSRARSPFKPRKEPSLPDLTIKRKARPQTAAKPTRERHPRINPIYSIGHSTLEIRRFIQILKTHQVTVLADIRSIPGSERNPQISIEN